MYSEYMLLLILRTASVCSLTSVSFINPLYYFLVLLEFMHVRQLPNVVFLCFFMRFSFKFVALSYSFRYLERMFIRNPEETHDER